MRVGDLKLGRPLPELLEQPNVLDGDDGLVGERPEERDLVVGEAARRGARHGDRADRRVVKEHRHHELAPVPAVPRDRARRLGNPGIRLRVLDVDGGALANGAGVQSIRVDQHRKLGPQTLPAALVSGRERDEVDLIPGDARHHRRMAAQEPLDALHDRVEDGSHVGLRLADHPQDVRGRGLLLERRRQIAVALLQLLEQPGVLDGDDALIGEGLEQRELLGRERLGLGARDDDGPEGGAFVEHRDEEGRAPAEGLRRGAAELRRVGVRLDIGNVQRLPVDEDAADQASPRDGLRGEDARKFLPLALRAAGERHEMRVGPVEAVHDARPGRAQPPGAPRDRVEDRLHVGVRARDGAQDLVRRVLAVRRLPMPCRECGQSIGQVHHAPFQPLDRRGPG